LAWCAFNEHLLGDKDLPVKREQVQVYARSRPHV